MLTLIADTETNGFLEDLDRIHCIVLRDAADGRVVHSSRGTPAAMATAFGIMDQADAIVWHNGISFDIPALTKVFPGFTQPISKVRDTLLLGRILWPEIKQGDFARVRKGVMPSSCLARPFALKSWGYRLGIYKGDFGETADWSVWTKEMQDYCEQDTAVTLALWNRIKARGLDPRCQDIEHSVAELCVRITGNGFPFDAKQGGQLYARVEADKAVVEERLQARFPPITTTALWTPKASNKTLGYVKGEPISRTSTERFNPASREQIADRLIAAHGWVPTQYTAPTGRYPNGQVQVDEPVLEGLPYPEAPLLLDYLLLEKRAAALAGTQGYLKLEEGGRIHGRYSTTGAITGRPTHSRPNITQVVKSCPRYGKVFRSLFGPGAGRVQVGVDMSGLELRCLAHYLATFDGGDYAASVTTGDVHTVNMTAAGLSTRDQAKTFIYAFLYGAGAWKLGHIVDPLLSDEEKVRQGTALKARFLKNTPALKKLMQGVSQAVESRGHLIGLDGRPLTVRHKHAALNTLLQSAGAILCKAWIVACERRLLDMGLVHGRDGDFYFLAWIHDELQISARTEELAGTVRDVCIAETTNTGRFFNLSCPLAGEGKVGANWSETH